MSKETTKIWRENHKEQVRKYRKKWSDNNKAKIKEWRQKNHVARTEYERTYAQKNKIRRRNMYVSRTYNISESEYNEIFVKQNGKCAICGKHQTELTSFLSVDHCHQTNFIRGLLCGKCNRAIGLLDDDIENLRCAIIYLQKGQSKI